MYASQVRVGDHVQWGRSVRVVVDVRRFHVPRVGEMYRFLCGTPDGQLTDAIDVRAAGQVTLAARSLTR